MNVYKYNEFFLEKEFDSIINELFIIFESDGVWKNDNTIEWEIDNKSNFKDKLKNFLSKLPKEKIKGYFIKLMNKIKDFPYNKRKKLIIIITSVFLTFVSMDYLIGAFGSDLTKSQVEEIIKVNNDEKEKEIYNKASFIEAQKLIKLAEAGYSSDRHDKGNWIISNGEKKFIGTNHGISAPILKKYLGRTLTKQDMINLSYQTALKIFKNNYWTPLKLDLFKNQSIANIIYDGCVNQGIGAMRSIVKNAAEENGIKIEANDNVFSDKIINELNNLDQKKLFNSIKKNRKIKYENSKTFKIHGKGWLKRLDSISYD